MRFLVAIFIVFTTICCCDQASSASSARICWKKVTRPKVSLVNGQKETIYITKHLKACCPGHTIFRGKCVPLCEKKCKNSKCTTPNKCTCLKGYRRYTDTECVPDCKDNCNHGFCSAPGVCECYKGYAWNSTTSECEPKCSPPCINGFCSDPDFCECYEGYRYSGSQQNCIIENKSTSEGPIKTSSVSESTTAKYLMDEAKSKIMAIDFESRLESYSTSTLVEMDDTTSRQVAVLNELAKEYLNDFEFSTDSQNSSISDFHKDSSISFLYSKEFYSSKTETVETMEKNTSETKSQITSETQLETTAETSSENTSETTAKASSEIQSKTTSETKAETQPENTSETTSETTAENSSETQAKTTSETSEETSSENTSETTAETSSEIQSKTTSETKAETQPENTSETTAENSSETQAKSTSETSSENTSETTSETLSETSSETSLELTSDTTEVPNEISVILVEKASLGKAAFSALHIFILLAALLGIFGLLKIVSQWCYARQYNIDKEERKLGIVQYSAARDDLITA